MKNIIISLLCAASFFVAAIIASAQEVAQSQKTAVVTSYMPHASNQNDASMGIKGMIGMTPSQSALAEPALIGTASRDIIIPTLTGRISSISNGNVEFSSAPLISSGSTLHRTVLSLTVSFTKNPLGGILKVRGDIMPLFSGVGSSVRPKKTYEIIEATDELDEAQLQDAMERVTSTLEGNAPIALEH